jgi:hypothetical protein
VNRGIVDEIKKTTANSFKGTCSQHWSVSSRINRKTKESRYKLMEQMGRLQNERGSNWRRGILRMADDD